MDIRFVAEVRRPGGVEPFARQSIEKVLAHGRVLGLKQVLQVVWASRERVRSLNRRFRNKNRFTDVIAFRYDSAVRSGQKKDGFLMGPGQGEQPFGDLFIAIPQAKINAERFGVTLREELVRLATHGALHLLGYTDYVPAEKKKMWAVQERILGDVLSSRRKKKK